MPLTPLADEQWTELVNNQYSEIRKVIDPMLTKLSKEYKLEFSVRMARQGFGGVFSALVHLETPLATTVSKQFSIYVELVGQRTPRHADTYGHTGVVKFRHSRGARVYDNTHWRNWDAKWFPALEAALTSWVGAWVGSAADRTRVELQAPKIVAYLESLPASPGTLERKVTVQMSWDRARFEEIKVLVTRKDEQTEFIYVLDGDGGLLLSKTITTPLCPKPVFQVNG